MSKVSKGWIVTHDADSIKGRIGSRLLYSIVATIAGFTCPIFGYTALPSPMQNYCPIIVVNQTTVDPKEVYFLAHGLDPNGFPSFLVPDSTGRCQFVPPIPGKAQPNSISSTTALSNLPRVDESLGFGSNAYLLYIPTNSSSRGYFSIHNRMFLATQLNPARGVMGINDPSVLSLSDPNFYTLYQNIEFGLPTSVVDSTTNLYLNLSWVDYFCLPMQLTTYSYKNKSKAEIIQYPAVLPAGIPLGLTREHVITSMMGTLKKGGTEWEGLGVKFYDDPYSSTGTSIGYTRILAPKNSLALGSPEAKKLVGTSPNCAQTYFPIDYCDNVRGFHFLQEVCNYYKNNVLYASILPAGYNHTVIYAMNSDGSKLQFTQVPSGGSLPSGTIPDYTLDITQNGLTTERLLSGSVWPFMSKQSPEKAVTDELSKLVSALFTVGHLPYVFGTNTKENRTDCPCFENQVLPSPEKKPSPTCPFSNSNCGFQYLSYFSNPQVTPFNTSQKAWYNLYDQALHQLQISTQLSACPQVGTTHMCVPSNPTLGLGYGQDYDDLLNMSGIIAGIPVQGALGKASQVPLQESPFIVVTLGSISGTPDMNIGMETYTYKVVIGPAANGIQPRFSYYSPQGKKNITTASLTTPTDLGSIQVTPTQPFQVTFPFQGVDYTYNIHLKRQIVIPLPENGYTAADVHFQGGFSFDVSTMPGETTPTFTLMYNSSPPPWPG